MTQAGVVATFPATDQTVDRDGIAIDSNGTIFGSGIDTFLNSISQFGTVTAFNFPNTRDFITSLTTDSTGNLYAGTRGTGAQIFKISF